MRFYCVFFTLLLSNFLFSQDTLQRKSFDKEVLIYQNRLNKLNWFQSNRSVSVLKGEELKNIPAVDFNSIASFLPGVEIVQRGVLSAQADLVISGGTFDQSLLMLNGYKLSDIQTGHHTLNIPIPLGAISNIQLFRGTQSRLFGVGALTGALNISTAPNPKNGVVAHLYSGSNFQSDTSSGNLYTSGGIHITNHFGGKKDRFLVALAHDRTNGYRFNSAVERTSAMIQSSHQIDNSNLQLLASGMMQEFGANGFYAHPFDKNSKEKIHTATIGGTYHSTIFGWKNTFRTYYRFHRDNYILRDYQPNFYQNTHNGQIFGTENHITKSNSLGTIGLGIDYRYEKIESNNLGNHRRKNLGAFLEQKFQPTSKLDITAGAYLNYNSDFGTNIFPGIEIGYNITNDLRVFGSSEWGMRNPTYTDLYYTDRANIGNPNLVAEKGSTHTLGVKWNTEGWKCEISSFYRNLSNMIIWADSDPSAARIWQPQNNKIMDAIGLMTTFHLAPIQLGKKAQFHANVSYNYLNFFQNLSGTKYSIQALRHQLIGGFFVNAFSNKIQLNQFIKYYTHLNGQAYLIADTKLQYNIGKISIYGMVNNLTASKYTMLEVIEMPKRWGTVGIIFNSF